MPSPTDPERRLRRSWSANAGAWSRAVRGGRIPSRVAVTDAAIVRAVTAIGREPILDVGCGEGWLAHALAAEGLEVVGFDASEALVAAAREGAGTFRVAGYDELARDATLLPGPFGVAVCNFSLLHEELRPLLAALRERLGRDGRLVVQTPHPWVASGRGGYRDGWREETFDAFDEPFAEPMPWFHRTMSSWLTSLRDAGLELVALDEPRASDEASPASLLLTAAPRRDRKRPPHTPHG